MWIPAEAAAQLSHDLKLLRDWSKANEPLSPVLTLLIKIELSEIEYLLDMDTVVPAAHWQAVVQRIQLLTEQLMSLR